MSVEKFVGGMNVPTGRVGRFNATWPLAVLVLHDSRLFELRGRGVLARFPNAAVAVPAADIREVSEVVF
jgi:hypothetical protein